MGCGWCASTRQGWHAGARPVVLCAGGGGIDCGRYGFLKLQKLDALQVCLVGCCMGLQSPLLGRLVALQHTPHEWHTHAAWQLVCLSWRNNPLQAATTLPYARRPARSAFQHSAPLRTKGCVQHHSLRTLTHLLASGAMQQHVHQEQHRVLACIAACSRDSPKHKPNHSASQSYVSQFVRSARHVHTDTWSCPRCLVRQSFGSSQERMWVTKVKVLHASCSLCCTAAAQPNTG
jgi:hypothetical protein